MLETLFTRPPENEADFKACCAAFYESPVVRFLLGQSWRPGGITLTREISRKALIGTEDRVLDIACGSGDSSQVTAGECGAKVVGLDLSTANLSLASNRFAGEGWWSRTGWTAGEAELLRFADASFDVAMVECALCTFPDKDAAVAEVRCVLKPDGRFVLAAVTLQPDSLPADLAAPVARIARLSDALPIEEYVRLLEVAEFEVETLVDCRGAVDEFLGSIDKKLLLARIAQAVGKLDVEGINIKEARRLLAAARECVGRGSLGYVYLVGVRS